MSFWSKTTTQDDEISIHKAAREGDLEKVKTVLKRNPDMVFSKDSDGRTPLHWSAEHGHKAVVDLLLFKKADVNAKTNNGMTPLLVATGVWCQKAAVELLLANQADVNAKSNDGTTPLHHAALHGYKDVAELLLAHKPDVNAKNSDGRTPFALAKFMGHEDVAELLRSHGVSCNLPRSSGANLNRWKASEEPESWVARHLQGWNHNDWLELLAALRNSQYWPMEEAEIGQHLEMLRDKLRTQVCLPNIGMHQLIEAVRDGDLEKVKSLLKEKPDWVSSKNDVGQTLLHCAALNGHTDVAKLLLEKGADVNAKDKSGKTPLNYAAVNWGPNADVRELLRKQGGILDTDANIQEEFDQLWITADKIQKDSIKRGGRDEGDAFIKRYVYERMIKKYPLEPRHFAVLEQGFAVHWSPSFPSGWTHSSGRRVNG